MTFVQRSNQIWPELSLHDQYQLRINLIEETIERIGQIIRQVNVLNIVAKGGLDALRAGRRHGRYGNRQIGIAMT
ncbi:Uncharacterised protein [Salmonella enterica subsp. enterica]|uniref:Uncharacterized protein n=1 Tax=Salmonella enterica I TaxID=59201 RepID=A0A379VHN7_SALET|nr:Uncharacterised protein [Salmonella enterica subsp. enterica]